MLHCWTYSIIVVVCFVFQPHNGFSSFADSGKMNELARAHERCVDLCVDIGCAFLVQNLHEFRAQRVASDVRTEIRGRAKKKDILFRFEKR